MGGAAVLAGGGLRRTAARLGAGAMRLSCVAGVPPLCLRHLPPEGGEQLGTGGLSPCWGENIGVDGLSPRWGENIVGVGGLSSRWGENLWGRA